MDMTRGLTTELYNSIEGIKVSLPLIFVVYFDHCIFRWSKYTTIIVDGNSGRRKVPMVKFLTPIYV